MNTIRLSLVLPLVLVPSLAAEPLPGTKPLTTEGDLAAQMVAGIDKYLMRALAEAPGKRKDLWNPDYASAEAYAKSIQPQHDRLRKILGVVDPRVPFKDLDYVSGISQPALVGA